MIISIIYIADYSKWFLWLPPVISQGYNIPLTLAGSLIPQGSCFACRNHYFRECVKVGVSGNYWSNSLPQTMGLIKNKEHLDKRFSVPFCSTRCATKYFS